MYLHKDDDDSTCECVWMWKCCVARCDVAVIRLNGVYYARECILCRHSVVLESDEGAAGACSLLILIIILIGTIKIPSHMENDELVLISSDSAAGISATAEWQG